QRIQQVSGGMLTVEQGSLYPALYRIEQRGWIASKWERTETGRRAKFYRLSRSGRRQLKVEEESWDLLALAIANVRQAT
ncbi:MAG TPA: helix-turn-helix transcriptional regulator, partial [Blastocatellia bacterium]